jgi:hypothetical protein
MIDVSIIDKNKMLMIDKDGFMFILTQDWVAKSKGSKELRSIDLNKVGYIEEINAIQYVSNNLVFATTPKSSMILKLSDIPCNGNYFEIKS